MWYGLRASSFILTHFFALNLLGWFSVLSRKCAPLLYHYINLRLSIFFCVSSRNIYLTLGFYLSFVFVTVSELFFCEIFETLVTFWYSIIIPLSLREKCPNTELQIVSHDQEVFDCISHSSFSLYFYQHFYPNF